MNCDHCNEHILATTQIAWNKGNYHADCIGEAVLEYRASQEQIDKGLPPEPFLDEEPFEDEFSDYENEELIEEIVSDDILSQIPAQQPEFRPLPVNLPEGAMIVAPRAIIHPPQSNGVGTLISGRETTLINRSALKHLPVPEATTTFQPIPHYLLVEQIHESLSYRRLSVVREEYAVSPDGMKLFGLIELNVEYSGVRFAIGLRNANDKSMRIGLVAGYRVMVCENKMLTGDFNPLLAKHSKNFNLIDALSVAVDRIQRNIGKVEESIEYKKKYYLDEETARNMIYRAFLVDKFPMSLMRSLHQEFFVAPSYDEFKPRNLWSLENAFTTCFKKLKPVQQFEATAKLGKFLTPYVS